MTQTIGFIGLGLMGAGFTRRLASQGCEVIGYDIDPPMLAKAKGWGVKPAASPADAASRCDLVCICVTTTKAVAEVVSGKDGIVAAGDLGGKVVVDFSTTEMATTKAVATALAAAGASFIDGPVSGGPPAAEAGTLAIMASAPPGPSSSFWARSPTWARPAPARRPSWSTRPCA